jgi:hemolysin III
LIYILMGWIAIVAIVPLAETLSWKGFAWIAAGGIAYTVGTIFYLYDQRFKHWHGIWHLFVLAGSAFHYCAILLYVA